MDHKYAHLISKMLGFYGGRGGVDLKAESFEFPFAQSSQPSFLQVHFFLLGVEFTQGSFISEVLDFQMPLKCLHESVLAM